MLKTTCSRCLADLVFPAGKNLTYCEACGSVNARPKSDPEKTNLLKYANQLRAFGDFGAAESYYRDVLAQRMDEHEARMGIVYCRYGVIHVKDERAGRWLPTCRLENAKPMLTDQDFRQACADAEDESIRSRYTADAEYIDSIQRRIAALKTQSEPYDVFICYKETDLDTGLRTLDSEIAGDIYEALSNRGHRVFYARKTLSNQIGADYEAKIYHAIRTASMMLVVGTRAEHFRATWVRSEWKRFLDDVDAGMDKRLVPVYKGMHESGLPMDFVSYRFQGVDLDKFGAEGKLLDAVDEYLKNHGKTGEKTGEKVEGDPVKNQGLDPQISQMQEELERLRKAEEERKLKEELERLRKAEEEWKKREAEAARKAEEERKKREAEAARKAEEERKKREAEAARKAEEERKKREAEAARKAEEERKKREEEAARKAEEERKKREAEAAPSKRYSLEEIEAVDWGKYLKDDSGASKKAHVGADGEITDSWSEIFKAIDSGEYKKRYAIGNTKALDLGPEGVVHMQIAAFDTDDRADGKGEAPITWISRELLKTERRMNPERQSKKGLFKTTYVTGTGNIGGWKKCELRAALQKEVWPLVPAEVRGRILEVKKQQSAYNEKGDKVVQTTFDRLWIPDEIEVFGDEEWEEWSLDTVYTELFPNNESCVKRVVGSSSASWWWLRSAGYTLFVHGVGSGGTSGNYAVNYTGGVALGFCT